MEAYRPRHWAAMETAIWQEGDSPDARCGRLYTYHTGSIATIRVTFGLQGAPSIVEVAWHDGRTARWSIQSRRSPSIRISSG